MAGQVTRRARWALISCVLAGGLVVGTAQAREVQLAGMRLGQHAIDVLDIYGRPHALVWGIPGDQFETGAAAAGAMGGEGMEAGAGAEMMGAGAPMPEEEMGAEMEAAPGPGEFPTGEEAGVEGEAPAGAAAAAVTGNVQRNQYPIWGLPLWVTLNSGEVEWLYRCNGTLVGFVLDPRGFIQRIVVASERCNFARSSLWRPHEYIKLGDSYKRVIYRYGWPDETLTIDILAGTAPGGGMSAQAGAGVLGFIQEYSRDPVLCYYENNNIDFVLHNMKVVRIQIGAGD